MPRPLRRSWSRRAEELEHVVAHDAASFVFREVPQLLFEVERLGEAFSVRPVGAEEDALDPDEVGQRTEVLFAVGRDPEVPAKGVDRVLGEDPRRLVRLLRSRFARRWIQSDPFSMLATRSSGCRLNTPCTISDAIVSWMARSEVRIRLSTSVAPNASNVALPPHATAKEL